MSKLHLKMARDIRFMPFMFAGIVFLLAIGMILFGASYALYLNLQGSYALSYRMLHLADFLVPVQSAPSSVVGVLRTLPGVRRVEGRIVAEVELELPGREATKVIGRIISLPDTGEPAVNRLKLTAGAYPGRGPVREILLEASFAEYHGLAPGDAMDVVVQGDAVRFRIAGIVQSPEYIYVVRGQESPFPMHGTFGVIWMRKSMVDTLLDTDGAVNELAFTMVPGATRSSAMRLAERLLGPYGADEAIAQEDLPSVKLLRLDLIGLRQLAIFFPLLFLIISSFSVYNLLGRMVHAQRNQIGFLRAIGFSHRAISAHYTLFSLLMGAVGGALGSVLGYILGIYITRWYTGFIEVPYFDAAPRWGVALGGFMMALLVTVVSGLLPTRAAARLAPAEAISVEAPAVGRAPIVEQYLPFLRQFSLLARLPLRNFLRSVRRSLATIAGVASAVILLLVSMSMLDSSRAMIEFFFQHSIRYDILATYLQPQPQTVLQRVRALPGITRAEPVLVVPAQLVKGGRSQTILLYGIAPDSQCFRLTTSRGERMPLAPEGVMVSSLTAKHLGLWEGGNVRLTLPKRTMPDIAPLAEASRIGPLNWPPVPAIVFRAQVVAPGRSLLEVQLDRQVIVSGVTYQPIGTVAYASIEQVRQWYGRALELPPAALNALAIRADVRYQRTLERELSDLDDVVSVEVIRTLRDEIDQLMEQSRTFFFVMLAFSVALAGVILFNTTMMNVIERTREIATMRTMGVSIGAVARMICVENLLAYALGILAGVPLGIWLAHYFIAAYESESFSLRTVIYAQTYAVTILGILATVLLAQLPGIRYIRQIELAKATKEM